MKWKTSDMKRNEIQILAYVGTRRTDSRQIHCELVMQVLKGQQQNCYCQLFLLSMYWVKPMTLINTFSPEVMEISHCKHAGQIKPAIRLIGISCVFC